MFSWALDVILKLGLLWFLFKINKIDEVNIGIHNLEVITLTCCLMIPASYSH